MTPLLMVNNWCSKSEVKIWELNSVNADKIWIKKKKQNAGKNKLFPSSKWRHIISIVNYKASQAKNGLLWYESKKLITWTHLETAFFLSILNNWCKIVISISVKVLANTAYYKTFNLLTRLSLNLTSILQKSKLWTS